VKLEIKNISNSLNKAYLAQCPFIDEINLFKENYSTLLKSIKQSDSEETLKDYINDFLKNTYYKGKFITKENVNNIDLIILNGKNADDKIGVIIETKALKSPEMITKDELNKKAFQELIQYYLEERIKNENVEIKHLIITNSIDWFIFNATEFERLFYQNKNFEKKYNDWYSGKLVSKNKDWFYSELAKPFIENEQENITCTYFQLSENLINNENSLIELYKIFSPEHLLKLPFLNDSNTLNREFYNELLHIIGLQETKVNNVRRIERLEKNNRHDGSLIENTINILISDEIIHNIKEPEHFGDVQEEQLFSIGLELCITWLNRILFLKLLESQLIKYNNSNKEYLFLNNSKIRDFEELRELFFEVLAVKPSERKKGLHAKYEKIPYLNSSLFEQTALEKEAVKINQLKNHYELPVHGATVLKDENGKRITGSKPLLQYLFEFLDSYNFASDNKIEIQETNKSIINSSVLGLIFEKINGYKDGSYFTPGFVTMYMCRENLRKAIVEKFKTEKEFNNIQNFTDLYNQIDKVPLKKANEIFNTLKVCDPAVGSGHFLVSALNELIAIKSDLRILTDNENKKLRDVTIDIVKDELFITVDSVPFSYNNKNVESQRIQETIFHEKQKLIENCLFGVDINPKSVNICRLRLWIELLKNAYYTKQSDFKELETLPNIDINIKCGNSLISHFALNGNGNSNCNSQSLKTFTQKYKQVVAEYKDTTDRNTKRTLERFIQEQKENFARTVNPNDEDLKKIRKIESEIGSMPLFFNKDEQIQWQMKHQRFEKERQELQKNYDDKLKTVYNNAFEWRFEFPEVLDDNGYFTGFDVIIGNPPYIKEMDGKKIFMPLRKSGLWSEYIDGKMDLWFFFLHKAFDISSKKGLISYITNSYWVKSSGSKKLIKRIYQNKSLCEIVNFNNMPIFEKVVGKHMIHSYSKNIPNEIIKYRNFDENTKFESVENIPFVELKFNDIVKETYININSEQNIELTIENDILGSFYNVSQGVVEAPDKLDNKTGVFVISDDELKSLKLNTKENQVIKKYLNTSDIEKYKITWNSQYLIFSDKITREKIAKNEFPNLKKHLDKYKDFITSSNKPYGIHRDRSSKINPFEQPKLICKGMFKEPEFTFDENSYYVGFSFSIIWQKEKNYDLKFLLGLLNSNFGKYWFTANGKKRGVGVDIGVERFREFPIPVFAMKQQQKIIDLVNIITDLKTNNQPTEKQEKELNKNVNTIYKLTKDDIEMINK